MGDAYMEEIPWMNHGFAGVVKRQLSPIGGKELMVQCSMLDPMLRQVMSR